MFNFQDKVAVVTGAASGIGRATSVALAERGCDLAIADLNEAGLAETAEMVASLGRKATIHLVDVADKAAMEAFPEQVIAEHGKVNIIVNNAGVEVTNTFEDHSLEDFEWIMGINVWGVIYGCKFFLPYLKQSGEGHIVNISSMFGFYGMPSQSSYCATKFAVRGLTESLRIELKDSPVGVTCIHPGGINTNIIKNARVQNTKLQENSDRFMKFTTKPQTAAKKIINGIEKNKRRVCIGPDAHISDWLVRLSPVGFNVLATSARRVFGT